ncbi:hypothetical protein [Corynebacterium coyleae]|uniref:hypothetical protein n=1 Tax=Corynebacterium coyleae TaxID=53374 RepID=UPI00254CDAA8|nr:hypothetical protein [Corynebacterium coyleae]MDK8242526.1 hypothetical protein [Corynebacterium coyleae]
MTITQKIDRIEYLHLRATGEARAPQFVDDVSALEATNGYRTWEYREAMRLLAEEVEQLAGDDAQIIFNDVLNRIDPAWSVKLAG